MFIYLDLLLPTGSSDLPETDGPPYASFWSCFEWGLHMPRRLPCMRWSLKPPFHPYQFALAVYFCCTILGVASTGRYPASCPVKPGLSSPRRELLATPTSREHLSYSYFIFNPPLILAQENPMRQRTKSVVFSIFCQITKNIRL